MTPSGYSLARYGWMIDQPVRMDAYVAALRAAVRPGDVVFDIGAGPGAFALLACSFGAARAVAIESDPSVLLAPHLARSAGFAERVEVVHGLSSDYHPDQPADVIVADVRGNIPLFEHAIPTLVDARQRLLKPGGILIPARDRLWLGVVESAETYRPFLEPWDRNRFGLDLSAARQFVVNSFSVERFEPSDLLADPQPVATLDYATIERTDVTMPFDARIERDGTVHGLAVWFDTMLFQDIGYSTAPGCERTVYGQLFLPVASPVAVGEGDRIHGEVIAQLNGATYDWSWRTSIERSDARAVEFRQSTALAEAYGLACASEAELGPEG